MNANSHIQIDPELRANSVDDPNHRDTHLRHGIRLLFVLSSVVLIEKTHHNVAVTNCVYFKQTEPVALFVEICEQRTQHLDHLPCTVFVGEVGEADDVSV